MTQSRRLHGSLPQSGRKKKRKPGKHGVKPARKVGRGYPRNTESLCFKFGVKDKGRHIRQLGEGWKRVSEQSVS